MNSDDYDSLLRIVKRKREDKPTEEEIKQLERLGSKVSPIFKRIIDRVTDDRPPIVDDRFVRRNVEAKTRDNRYLNKLFLNFFIHVGLNVMDEKIKHVLFFPHSNAYEHKRRMFAELFVCVFTLLYDKTVWSLRDFVSLEEATAQFFDGKVEALRKLMHAYGQRDVSVTKPVDYEIYMRVPHQIYPYLWGPLVWAMIHFVAESFDLRDDSNENVRFAKNLWMSFTEHSLYRCLPCGFCMKHYEKIIKDHDLRNERDYAKLWFEIHNRVNDNKGKKRYSEEEFSKDREFMRYLLTAG